MLIEFILLLAIGIVFLVIGWLIWKKEKITLIQSYHYNKVSDTNKRAYTALVGKGTLIIGTGIIVTGIDERCLEDCAELMNVSVSTIKRINKKMKSRIIRIF